jgi:hypothetical protein
MPRRWRWLGWRSVGIPRSPLPRPAAYCDARAISAAPGITIDELRKLDALAVADSTGTLKPVRAAAAGEAWIHHHGPSTWRELCDWVKSA